MVPDCGFEPKVVSSTITALKIPEEYSVDDLIHFDYQKLIVEVKGQ